MQKIKGWTFFVFSFRETQSPLIVFRSLQFGGLFCATNFGHCVAHIYSQFCIRSSSALSTLIPISYRLNSRLRPDHVAHISLTVSPRTIISYNSNMIFLYLTYGGIITSSDANLFSCFTRGVSQIPHLKKIVIW